MNSQIAARKQQIIEELKSLDLRREFLKGHLAALEELGGTTASVPGLTATAITAAGQLLSTPAVSVGTAIGQGMKALQQFTKADVIKWVRSNYPRLEFSDRSWGRPLREMMRTGEVVMLKKNSGNRSQAVYGLKKRSEIQ